MRSFSILSALAGCTLALLSLPADAQQQPQEHVRGDVVKISGDTLDVRARDGQVMHLKLADQVGVSQAEPADPSAIAEGAFIGTTAVAQPDGTLRAVEVHVFPEAMRGTGEGNRPWDLGSKSSMTNATVSGMGGGMDTKKHSSMTNANVARMKTSGATRTLSLKYAGGEQTVVVPPGIPIVKLEPGDRSLVVPGAHVFVVAAKQADGTLLAQRLVVGKGMAPPM
jgi:hypothetical protein